MSSRKGAVSCRYLRVYNETVSEINKRSSPLYLFSRLEFEPQYSMFVRQEW